MKVICRGNVFAGQKGTERQSCAFPGICVLPGGRWLCSFRAAPMKTPLEGQHVLVSWSDNEGKDWTMPVSPFIPPSVDGKPGLFRCAYMTPAGGRKVLAVICWVDCSNRELPFFNEETEGLLDARIFLSWSENEGETWSKPQLVDTMPFNVPTAITGPVLMLPDGDIACQFELNKHYYDKSIWYHSSVMIFSRDGGKTWYRSSKSSSDPENRLFYWDQRPAVMRDGRILDLFWTFDRAMSVYLNIHACESSDCGRTWSDMWDTGVPGQPASPVSLPDGRIGMVYVDRTGAPVIKIRVSEDWGKTWPESTELVIFRENIMTQTKNKKSMQDAWSEMGKFSVGLPATALLSNGDILVVYYSGPYTDLTDICWARIET